MSVYFKKKRIRCPVCGFPRLIDAGINTESEVVSENEIVDGWQPDYYQKCARCRKEIGIRKI